MDTMAAAARMGSVLSAAALTAAAAGQCVPRWSAYAGAQLNNTVYALAGWDSDGSGPAPSVVIAGGNFDHAGATLLSYVGMWDGSVWRPIGAGVDGAVRAASVLDPDGPGPLTSQPVIGGYFVLSGSTTVNRIARFDGAQWRPLGTGVFGPGSFPGNVTAFASWNGSLYVSGVFGNAGAIAANGIARWDGSAWYSLPDERAGNADALAVSGGWLFGGGHFQSPTTPFPPTAGVLRWDGPTWVTVGQNYPGAPSDDVFAITTYRGELIIAGDIRDSNHILRFDGTSWQPLGSGLDFVAFALCTFDPDGPGPAPELLIVGGGFTMAGGHPASGVAAWDGSQWSALGGGTDGAVRALTVWNNTLVVGGDFFSAGGIVSPGMAFWGCPQAAPCYANCDQSTAAPVLNVGDFLCFMSAFSSQSPYANCDHSTTAPAMNIADFVCFMSQFATGCP
jgi:hypothetical protein